MGRLRGLWWAGLMCGVAAGCTTREPPIRFGTTYTLQQSGALAAIESLWAARDPEADLATVVGPSGLILRSAAGGDLDVVLTHAPALEARLLDTAAVRSRCTILLSRFAIAGPAADPARIRGTRSAAQAFRAIVSSGALFVSRGDSSGTHVKEREIWRRAEIEPSGSWYFEATSDQASSLRMAEEWGAYALADEPTLARQPDLQLVVLVRGASDPMLRNPYTLTLTTTAPAPAERFARWLTDSAAAMVVALIKLPDGQAGFEHPAGCVPSAPSSAAMARQSSMIGTWRYAGARPTGPGLGAGLQMEMRIDFAVADSFFGRVTRWFAGDVGMRPDDFGRVRGRLRADTVALAIPFARAPDSPVTVRGLLGHDTLTIIESRHRNDTGPFATGPRSVLVRVAP